MNENLPTITLGDHDLQYIGPLSFFDLAVDEQIDQGVVIANKFKHIIKSQNLFSVIGGKEYAKVEGWQVCGLFLKTHTREREVARLDDGSYKACIDIVRDDSGAVVGNGSAICGKDEKRWGNADEYARRSMAITRAIGKAYRSRFSWIINLAGYECTPEEEMPKEEKTAQKIDSTYQGTEAQIKKLTETLINRGIEPDKWDIIAAKMKGKKAIDLPKIIDEVTHAT